MAFDDNMPCMKAEDSLTGLTSKMVSEHTKFVDLHAFSNCVNFQTKVYQFDTAAQIGEKLVKHVHALLNP